jgi:hypothetical protein
VHQHINPHYDHLGQKTHETIRPIYLFELIDYAMVFWGIKEISEVSEPLKSAELSTDRLRSNIAEEAAEDVGEANPEEAGKAAEATLKVAIKMTRVMMHRGVKVLSTRTNMKTATAGELRPIACKKLFRRCSLCSCRKEISTCSLFHKSVLYRRTCSSTWPVGVIFLQFSLSSS